MVTYQQLLTLVQVVSAQIDAKNIARIHHDGNFDMMHSHYVELIIPLPISMLTITRTRSVHSIYWFQAQMEMRTYTMELIVGVCP
jgi:hypothetical protein